MQKSNKFAESYGKLLCQRPTSAKNEKSKPKGLSLSRNAANTSQDFLNSLKAKLQVNSPKMLEKYKAADIQNQFLKIRQAHQSRPVSVSLAKSVCEDKRHKLNLSEEKKYFYNNLIDGKLKVIQDKMNRSDFLKRNASLETGKSPDFSRIQSKLSNLESKI
jgi:hypothetical protein